MDELALIFPNENMEEKALQFKSEFFANGEKVINGSAMLDIKDNYFEWLKMISDSSRAETVNPNWVVSDTFFAVRKNDGKIVGIIDFRHYLNDFLKDFGHIGYSVTPTERKKGYATEMLCQVLKYAKNQGLSEVQLSCKVDNIASRKTILNNGGISKRFYEHDSKKAEVFIISL